MRRGTRFKAALLLSVLVAQQVAAFAALTEFYVQTTGDNTNAGSTTSDLAELESINGNWNSGTGVFICSGGTDLSGVTPGEWASVYNDGASTTVFIAKITNVNDGTDTITVSTTVKSGTAPTTSATGRTLKVGGAWKGPTGTVGHPWVFMQNTAIDNAGEKPIVYFKDGTYPVTGALGTHANAGILFEGYDTTPGDALLGTAISLPIIDGTGGAANSPFTLLIQDGDGCVFRWFHFKGNVPPGTTPGVSVAGTSILESTANNPIYDRILFTDSWRAGLKIDASGAYIVECEATDCNMDDASDFGGFWSIGPSTFERCISYRNNAAGAGGDNLGFNFNPGTGEIITAINCIAAENSKHGFQAQGGNGSVVLKGCISYDNTDSGFYSTGTGSSLWVIENCIAYGNSDYGFLRSTAADGATMIRNNGVGANGVAVSSNIGAEFITGTITLTADPFTDAANGDFSLNDDAGGGALLKNLGRGVFPNMAGDYSETTLAYPSVGLEPQPAAGGSAGTAVIIQ